MSDFFIEHWDFNASPPKPLPASDGCQIEPNHWCHCQRDEPELALWLEKQGIAPPIIESLVAHDTRPRFELYDDDSFLLILRGVNLNEGAVPDDMLSVRLYWFDDKLITTRKTPSKAIEKIKQVLASNQGPTSIAELIIAIIEGLNKNIEIFLNQVELNLDRIEDAENYDVDELYAIHKRLLKLKRFMKPQLYALDDFLEAEHSACEKIEVKVRNIYDTISRINESINFYLEQVNLMKADAEQEQTEKMNRNSYLFTVIAALFLPVSFLTGLLGINIGGMPGVDNSQAFGLFCLILVACFIGEYFLLRWLKFF